ncbi:MAG: hypothetical protein HOV80_20120 [Polyangiaceae bacterium]|nr:hypothetical protein [Polyangiaceae bacterium]
MTGTRCIVVVGTVSSLPTLSVTLARMVPDFLEEERLLSAEPQVLAEVFFGVPIAIVDESVANLSGVRAALATTSASLTAIGLVKERGSDGAKRFSSSGLAVVDHAGMPPLGEVFEALCRSEEEEASVVQLPPGVSPMSAALVHDINNTVMVIGNYIEIMLEDPGLGELRRQDLLEIGRATEKAKTLVAALQASQRASMGAPLTNGK